MHTFFPSKNCEDIIYIAILLVEEYYMAMKYLLLSFVLNFSGILKYKLYVFFCHFYSESLQQIEHNFVNTIFFTVDVCTHIICIFMLRTIDLLHD